MQKVHVHIHHHTVLNLQEVLNHQNLHLVDLNLDHLEAQAAKNHLEAIILEQVQVLNLLLADSNLEASQVQEVDHQIVRTLAVHPVDLNQGIFLHHRTTTQITILPQQTLQAHQAHTIKGAQEAEQDLYQYLFSEDQLSVIEDGASLVLYSNY